MSDQPALEGVAIIGVAGRFPGASTAEAFWRNVKAGVESISFFTDEELAAAGHDVAALRADPEFVPARGIIEKPEWFDAQFFGMTPLEAEATDPQQRVLLEVAWEALEEAGYDVSRYAGPIGVYAGVATNTYYLNFLQARPDVLKAIGPMQAMIGREKDFVATRIAYKLNLKGPALNVNSACSTSLVAVCQAVQSLLTFQCDMAVAGGATIAFPQHTGYVAEDEGITSPDGHTRAFDAEARGTAFSNGAGMVVLKRLEDAVADGDHVYAVIRAAALNNDGSDKASFMAPSSKGHAEVITMAHALAGVDPRSIGYVEAHGTATPIGDPIEVEGLTEAFRAGTGETGFCALGSVKTNVGHLEVAAGVAGLIKTAYSLHERVLTPSLHFTRPNPRIDFASSPFYVNTELRPWPGDGPRRAGVSSFGIGGTNAHVILEEPPLVEPSSPEPGPQLVVLSARTLAALDVAAQELASYLGARPDANLADVAFTLQNGRRAFPIRRALVAADVAGVIANLTSGGQAVTGRATGTKTPAFVFSGRAALSRGVVLELLDVPVFREALDRAIHAAPSGLRTTLAALTSSSSPHDEVSTPLGVALQYATAAFLESWGLRPQAVAGTDSGVLVAACVAGALTLSDALRIAALDVWNDRSRDVAASPELAAALRAVTFATPRLPIASNTGDGWLSEADAHEADAWLRQIAAPATVPAAIAARQDLAPISIGSGADDKAAADLNVWSGWTRASVLNAAGALWTRGCDLDWTTVGGQGRRHRLSLPTYPFERKRFCADPVRKEPVTAPIQPGPSAAPALSSVPAGETLSGPATDRVWSILPLAGDSPETLARLASEVDARLEAEPAAMAAIAARLQAQRPGLAIRRAVVAASAAEARRRITSESVSEQIRSPRAGALSRSVIFMFAGGGAQYASVAHGLFRDRPVFRRGFEACCALLDAPTADAVLHLVNTAPSAVTKADRALVERPSAGLPFLFAVEYGLVELWRSLGVSPVALIGHSLGEYTAACVSGVLSLQDAVELVAVRGRLFEKLERGSMMAVPAPPDVVTRYLGSRLDIAAINTPSSCVISGPVDEIRSAATLLQADDIDAVPLHIDVAAHSAMVEPIMAEFGARVRAATLNPPTVPFVSNVTGDWITTAEATNPDYWVRHLRQTVRFSDGVATLAQLANPLFLEAGPGRVLSSLVKGHPAVPAETPIVQSVRHPSEERDDVEMLMSATGRLWVSGVDINWSGAGPSEAGSVHMPERNAPQAYPSRETGNPSPPTPAVMPAPTSAAPPAPVVVREPRRVRIAAGLRGILQELGGVDATTIGDDTPFVELGFDSLSLTQVAQGVRKAFGVRIKFRQLLEAIPTIGALADHIDRELAPEPEPAAAPAATVPVHTAAATPAMSYAPPAAPQVSFPAVAAGSGGGQIVEDVIRVQLALMAEQLAVLRQAVGGSPAAVTPQAFAVVPPAAAPSHTGPSFAAPAAGGNAPVVTSAPAIPGTPPKKFGPYVPPDTKRRELGDRQQRALEALIARYTTRTRGSKALTDEQRPTLADARAVTGFKAQWKELIYQIAMVRSSGSRMVDVDGNEYVDFTMNFGASLFGHSPSFLTEAVEKQLHTGIELGALSPLASPVSRQLVRLTGMERVAFANTGTDAIMGALRAARTVTGRDGVIVFRGGYHGMNDEVLAQAQGSGDNPVILPAVPGVPANAVAATIVLDYEDPDCLEQLRRRLPHAAAVLIEPIQSRRPAFDARHLFGAIREMTRQAGVAMIFDELITGFRLHPRGAQGWFGVDVDIATYGKILGNGVPVAAIAGRAEFMEAFDGGLWRFGDDSQPEGNVTFYGGTHTRHPLGLAAAHAVLGKLEEEGPALQQSLNTRTAELCGRINGLLEKRGVSIRVDNAGSMFLFRFPSESDPGRGRASLESSAGTLERLLFYYLREKGIHIWDRPAFLSTAHSAEDLDRLVAAVESSVDEMLAAGFVEPVRVSAGEAQGSATSSPVTVTPSAVRHAADELPLSAGQKEIWLAAQVAEGGSLSFNQCVTLAFEGALDRAALEAALRRFTARHESLRIVFNPTGESQRIQSAIELPFVVADRPGLDDGAFTQAVEALIHTDSTTPFDLARGPLCRFTLVRQSPTHHVLIFDAHHIICDGWSVTTFLEELGPLYRAASGNVPDDLPPAAKFSDWVRESLAQDSRQDEAYWLGQFATPVPALEMPIDRPRPPMKTYRASTSIVRTSGEPVDLLRRASAEAGTTMFVGVLSAYALLLQKLSGQSDVVIGCAAAGQNVLDGESLVGHCVSLLPVRLQVNPSAPVSEYLGHVRRQVLDAFDHQNYTYGQLIEKLHVRRDASRQPLLSTLITYEVDSDQIDFGPLAVKVEAHPRRFCNFEIELHVRATRHDLLVWLYFNPDLFDQATVDRWTSYFVRIVGELGRDLRRPTGLVPAIPEQERGLILRDWNATETSAPAALMVSQFEARAAENPSAVAVEDHAGASLTRQLLSERSTRIARRLIAAGLDQAPVGVCVDRSANMVAALLGIFKAGAAYLPLDPALPSARIETMLDDSRASLLITEAHLVGGLPRGQRRYLLLEELLAPGEPIDAELPEITGETPAYVIYTSGSTGKPKGVQVTHGNLANFLVSMQKEPGFLPSDRILAITTTSFDIAGLELYLPLITGAGLMVASREQAADPTRLAALVENAGITVLQATPAAWRMLLDSGWKPKRPLRILCGGEAMTRDLANRLTAVSADVWNLYGPTETTIWSTVHRVSAGSGIVPIGKPIANTQTYVLDDMRQPVPVGVRGELFIGGDGVAAGYLHRPELTAERFIADPFSGKPGARMYRTGDAARYRPDGILECLERLDHQVKLRGFRIELGEIESALMLPGVSAAVVVLREDTPGDPRLVAYVTPATVDTQALRAAAREKLPDYMVPALVVALPQFPQTASGKVDRKQLPAPSGSEAPVRVSQAPSTVTEAVMAELWREVLRLPTIGIDDNFFDVGGHSLLAVKLVARMKERLGREVPFGLMLTHPTIRELAAHISPEEKKAIEVQAASGSSSLLVTLQPNGSAPALFFVHGIEGDVWTFVELARRFAGQRPVYGLQPADHGEAETSVEQMAARYVDEIKRVSPSGPYLLGGFCSGAAIAYEIAQQLQSRGDHVGLLAAIDYSFYETLRRPGFMGALQDFLANIGPWVVEDAIPAGPRVMLGRAASKTRLFWARVVSRGNGKSVGDVRDKLGLWRYLDHQVKMLETYARAFDRYKPRPYSGRVTVFRARTTPLFGRQPKADLGWGQLATGGVDVNVLAGSHDTLLKAPYVDAVAAALKQAISAPASETPVPLPAARPSLSSSHG